MVTTQESDGKTRWFSEDNDWTNSEGDTIAVWDGCIIAENEYEDFKQFIRKESGADTEPIGSFVDENKTEVFVFLVKSNIPQFSIWRFRCPGIKWWYDTFWSVNGGRLVSSSEITPILNKLGLKINEGVLDGILHEN